MTDNMISRQIRLRPKNLLYQNKWQFDQNNWQIEKAVRERCLDVLLFGRNVDPMVLEKRLKVEILIDTKGAPWIN